MGGGGHIGGGGFGWGGGRIGGGGFGWGGGRMGGGYYGRGGYGFGGLYPGFFGFGGLGYGLGYGYGYGYPYYGYGYGYPGYGYGLGYSGYGYGSGYYYPDYTYTTAYVDPTAGYLVNSYGNAGYVAAPGSGYVYSSAYGTAPLQATAAAAPSTFPLPSLGIDEKAVGDAASSHIQVTRVHPGSPAEARG